MKSFKKIVLCALSLLSATAAFAKANKQQIHLNNQYGHDVDVSVEWRMKAWPHTHSSNGLLLKSNRDNFLLKAPVSGCELFKIYTSPSLNRIAYAIPGLAGAAAGATAAGFVTASTGGAAAPILVAGVVAGQIAGRTSYEITRSLNHASAHAHSHKHFIIKAEKHNSKVAGQKTNCNSWLQ